MNLKHSLSTLVAFATLAGFSATAFAQAAGVGAAYNKAERAKIQEQTRLEKVDPPIRPDPVGNALIGGAVTGTMKGAAAGAISATRGAGVGTAVQAAKQEIQKSKVENELDLPRFHGHI